MDEKKLLEEYIKLFGDEPPFPPVHIMETLVEMKSDGTFPGRMEQIKPHLESFREKIEDVTGEEMSLENPFFDINFKESDEGKKQVKTNFYENGQKKSEETLKDGKPDGLWTEWYENGQKKFEGTYKDGKPDGLVTWWNENGQKERERNYKDGKEDF